MLIKVLYKNLVKKNIMSFKMGRGVSCPYDIVKGWLK